MKIPWRRERLPTPVFWPGEFYGLYSPWGRKELGITERLSLTYSALWNSEKVMEARGLPTRNGGQKGLRALESHRALLSIGISVAGGDWAPSLRILPLAGGVTLEARNSN